MARPSEFSNIAPNQPTASMDAAGLRCSRATATTAFGPTFCRSWQPGCAAGSRRLSTPWPGHANPPAGAQCSRQLQLGSPHPREPRSDPPSTDQNNPRKRHIGKEATRASRRCRLDQASLIGSARRQRPHNPLDAQEAPEQGRHQKNDVDAATIGRCLEVPPRSGKPRPPVRPARPQPPCGPGCGSGRWWCARHEILTGLQQVECAALRNEIQAGAGNCSIRSAASAS